MAITDIRSYINFIPAIKEMPDSAVWLSYDREADTLYINFKKPSVATDSELTNEDVIVRYDGDSIIGLTVLHASQRG